MKNYSNECLYKDTYTIIEMMDEKMRNKISKKFIDFLKENQDVNFEGTINSSIPLKNQELRYEIRLMLSLIYINYICDDETQKQIMEQEEENIKKFYNRDIFEEKVEENKDEPLEMTVYKENFWEKIIKKIKLFIMKK